MISTFFLGIVFSFLGYTPPSVLNMTALKIRLNGNKRAFNQFLSGALCIVLFQTYASIYLTQYISNNEWLLILLQKLGVVVLLLLSVYFYRLNKKEKKQSTKIIESKKPFVSGIVLSSLNMFAIPFFSGIIALLVSFNLIDFRFSSILLFITGSVIGTYYILYLYGRYAYKIQQKTGKLTNHINLILCLITAAFAVFTIVKLML